MNIFRTIKNAWTRKNVQPVTTPLTQPEPAPDPYKPLTDDERKVWFEDILKKMNCEFTIKKWKEGWEYNTVYQGGKFRILLPNNSPYIELRFPFFFTTEQERINEVRITCNDMMNKYRSTKFSYIIDYEKRKVHVNADTDNVLVPMAADEKLILNDMLTRNFEYRREFNERFNILLKEPAIDLEDPEQSYANRKTEMYMLRSVEMVADGQELGNYENIPDSPNLGDIVCELLGIQDYHWQTMRIDKGEGKTSVINNPIDIELYRVLDAVIGKDKNGRTIMENKRVVITVGFTTTEEPHKNQTLQIILTDEDDDDVTIYVRISLVLLPTSLDRQRSASSLGNQPVVHSFLLGYDRVQGNRRDQEFIYMWNEAHDKLAEGDYSKLTPDEMLIADCSEANLARMLYWGRKFFLNKRYYEAISYLKNAFETLKTKFHTLSDKWREHFFELTYYLGFSYAQLQQYKLAYYYLDALLPLNKINYTMEFLNVLVLSNDFRAMPFIQRLNVDLQGILNNLDEEDEKRPNIEALAQFVRFHQGVLLLKWGEIDEAEKIFKELINTAEFGDACIKQLAEIQRQRRLAAEEKADEEYLDNLLNEHIDKYADRLVDSLASSLANSPADKKTDANADKKTEKDYNKNTDKKTDDENKEDTPEKHP